MVVDGSVFTSNIKFDHRIVQLSACPVSDSSSSANVGFLLACNLYAVHWFAVRIMGHGSDSEKPGLVYLGSKLFKSCAVVHACWNPHMLEECVVLLEGGELFLFDMNFPCMNGRFRGKRISVSWDEVGESAGSGWFSCEFSWHPRILVVANSKAIYLVDCRFGKCQLSCLLTVEMLGMNDIIEKDQFVAFCRAGNDGFFYTVASEHWLILCDVRKPSMPVLKWAHNLHEPRYMTVLPLSELRSHPRDEKYAGVSAIGFAIVLGSFWSNDFSLFCYGHLPPGVKASCFTRVSKLSNSFYAWELPSQFSLRGQDCLCANCVMKEEFLKDNLPEWIELQQKKDLALGFFILDKDLSTLLFQQGDHGGFTLVRLMSSGKLEMQQYCALWKIAKLVPETHEETRLNFKNFLLCSMGDEKYKFPRRFRYLKLEYLYAHLNDDLAKILFSKFRNAPMMETEKKGSNERFRKFVSEKLNSFGCNPPISHLSASDVFRDVYMPTSLHEIVNRVMWLRLPMDILEVAFSDYSDLHGFLVDQRKVSLDFPVIPDKNQAPPFLLRNPSHRSNKWSSKEKPSDDFVGPVVSLPASLVLSEIFTHGISFTGKVNEFSPEEAFTLQYKAVMCLAKEMGVFNSCSEQDKHYAVSLVDDREETWVGSSNPNPLFLYEPSAFFDELHYLDVVEEPNGFAQDSERFNVMIAKLPGNVSVDQGREKDVLKLFDDLCPVELKFDDCSQSKKADGEELRAYELLKTQFSQWQDGFILYGNLRSQLKPQQQDLKFCLP